MLPMLSPHRILKMKSLHKLYFIVLLAVSYGYAQDGTTVFVTGEVKDVKKEKTPLFGEAAAFSNFTFSLPFKANENYDRYDDYDDSWFLPDGITFHGGFGVHTTRTIAVSANAGIDGLISSKLVAAPVYGSLLLNIKFNDDTTMYAQAGIGKAFALGRGDLSGLYQKYRIGFSNGEHLGFFAEVNYYGFSVYDTKQLGTFNLGISLFNFN